MPQSSLSFLMGYHTGHWTYILFTRVIDFIHGQSSKFSSYSVLLAGMHTQKERNMGKAKSKYLIGGQEIGWCMYQPG